MCSRLCVTSLTMVGVAVVDYRSAPPPRPTQQRPAPQHYEEPQHAAPQFISMSNNDVASKVVDAYKVNPMLTGLLLLNLLIFCGAGWYLNVVQERTAMYVKSRDGDLKELQNKALDMASKCIVPDTFQQRQQYSQPVPQYYPQPAPQPYQPPAPQPSPPPVAVAPAPPRPTK